MWSSDVIAHPPHGCAFLDAFLLPTGIKSGYWPHRSISIISNQSDLSHQHGLLACGTFNLPLTVIFLCLLFSNFV